MDNQSSCKIYIPNDPEGFSQWLESKKVILQICEFAKGKTLREFWDTCPSGAWLTYLMNLSHTFKTKDEEYDIRKMMDVARKERDLCQKKLQEEYDAVVEPARQKYDEGLRALGDIQDNRLADAFRASIKFPFLVTPSDGLEICPDCGREMCEEEFTDWFLYGDGKAIPRTRLKAVYTVWRCSCGTVVSDERGELAREEAVHAHVNSK